MTATPITIIVAALKPTWGIGHQGKLPWRLKKEIKYFKQVTTHSKPGFSNVVIMGRKTFDSIPEKFRPLPNRINVVLSTTYSNEKLSDNLFHANSFENSLSLLSSSNIDKIFIIGGAQLYNSLINHPLITSLLITEIESSLNPPMDTFLSFNLDSDWNQSSSLELKQFLDNDVIDLEEDIVEGDYTYNYRLYTRK